MLWKFTVVFVFLISSFSTNASITEPEYMEWNWEQTVFNVSPGETIELWGVLTNTADFSLGIKYNGHGYGTGTILDNIILNTKGPYDLTIDYSSLNEIDFYNNPRLESNDSVRFRFGVLTPNENMAPGSYISGNYWLSFLYSPQHTDPMAQSLFTVNVNAVPIPGAVWLFGSVLIGMITLKRSNPATS